MKKPEERTEAERVLEAWVREEGSLDALGADDVLLRLLRDARHGTPGMTEAEAGALLERVLARVPAPHTPTLRPSLAWAVVASVLAIAAVLLSRTPASAPTPRSQQVEIVKEVFFESVSDGKVVRFAMTAYRTVERKDGDGAFKPSR